MAAQGRVSRAGVAGFQSGCPVFGCAEYKYRRDDIQRHCKKHHLNIYFNDLTLPNGHFNFNNVEIIADNALTAFLQRKQAELAQQQQQHLPPPPPPPPPPAPIAPAQPHPQPQPPPPKTAEQLLQEQHWAAMQNMADTNPALLAQLAYQDLL